MYSDEDTELYSHIEPIECTSPMNSLSSSTSSSSTSLSVAPQELSLEQPSSINTNKYIVTREQEMCSDLEQINIKSANIANETATRTSLSSHRCGLSGSNIERELSINTQQYSEDKYKLQATSMQKVEPYNDKVTQEEGIKQRTSNDTANTSVIRILFDKNDYNNHNNNNNTCKDDDYVGKNTHNVYNSSVESSLFAELPLSEKSKTEMDNKVATNNRGVSENNYMGTAATAYSFQEEGECQEEEVITSTSSSNVNKPTLPASPSRISVQCYSEFPTPVHCSPIPTKENTHVTRKLPTSVTYNEKQHINAECTLEESTLADNEKLYIKAIPIPGLHFPILFTSSEHFDNIYNDANRRHAIQCKYSENTIEENNACFTPDYFYSEINNKDIEEKHNTLLAIDSWLEQ